MIQTDGQHLLNEIKDHPDCDTRRLVYADWLDEQDDKYSQLHAEFIRLQIDIHQIQPEFVLDWAMNSAVFDASADPKIVRCAEVCRQMILEHYQRTRRLLGSCLSWRRGFVESWSGDSFYWNPIVVEFLENQPVQKINLKNHLVPMYRFNQPNRIWEQWLSFGDGLAARLFLSDREHQATMSQPWPDREMAFRILKNGFKQFKTGVWSIAGSQTW